MKRIVLKTQEKSAQIEILCGAGIAEKELSERLKKYERKLVFTDSNVCRLYREQIGRMTGGAPLFVMEAGEEHKTPETLFALLNQMAEAGLKRTSCLVALGGGVVGDVGGLAASLYMRGIACIQVPTTLLAQVDSSVGGKTAVDFAGVKNLIGTFYQPSCVIADSDFFKTLPPREIRCGMGEMIKHGALSAPLFDRMTERELGLKELASLVPENIAFKASVVERDERESGLRKCLNLGHTTGHALELSDKKLSHGEYVLLGLLLEAEIAKKHLPCDGAYLERLKALARTALGEFTMPDLGRAAELVKFDKKNTTAGKVVLTVPVKKGEYALLELDEETYLKELGGLA